MRIDTVIVLLFTLTILFSAIVLTPVLIGVQAQSSTRVISAQGLGVKITSPSGNITVPSGPLTIYGISSDTAKTNCKVFIDWNDLKPMQNVTAKGAGGGNDYSNWTYTYTEKYHTIAPGINELTSKITCFDNPNNITSKYYSINITGLKNNTVSPTLPSNSNNLPLGFHNLGYLPQYDGFYHNVFQPTLENESLTQDSSNRNNPADNSHESKDDGNNDGSDSTNNDDGNNNDDSQSQSNSDSDGDDSKNSSSEGNDDDNKQSTGRTHDSQEDGNKENRDKHEKKHNHDNENKDKGSEKHKAAHSKKSKGS